MQCLDYFKFFPNDSKINKSVVGFLFISGLFQSACFFEMIYHPFINGFGDLNVWNNTRWTWWSEPIVSSIIAVFCQAFFLDRCWRVTKSYIVLIVAVIGMVAAIAFGIACTYFLSDFVLFTNSNFIQSKVSCNKNFLRKALLNFEC